MEDKKSLKEFLVSFNFRDYRDSQKGGEYKHQLLKEKLGSYKDEIEKYMKNMKLHCDVEKILYGNANYKLLFDDIYMSLSKITSPLSPSTQMAYFLEDFLLDYINLYKNVFKDEIKKLGEKDPKLKKIFDELPDKIKQANKDPDKLTVWAYFTFMLIGTLFTGTLLLISKDARQMLSHPIIKTRLLKVQNAYEKSIKQIEKIKDKQKSKTDNERN